MTAMKFANRSTDGLRRAMPTAVAGQTLRKERHGIVASWRCFKYEGRNEKRQGNKPGDAQTTAGTCRRRDSFNSVKSNTLVARGIQLPFAPAVSLFFDIPISLHHELVIAPRTSSPQHLGAYPVTSWLLRSGFFGGSSGSFSAQLRPLLFLLFLCVVSSNYS